MLWSHEDHEPQLLKPTHSRAQETPPIALGRTCSPGLCAATTETLAARRLCAATRESPQAATETQSSPEKERKRKEGREAGREEGRKEAV